MVRRRQVHGGDADGAAEAAAVGNRAGQAVAMAQEIGGPLHLSAFDKGADIGGADGDAVPGHLGDDVAADAQLPAAGLELLGVPLVPVAEVVIMARHQVDGPVGPHQQAIDKLLPGHGHHGVVKGGNDDLADAVKPLHQIPAVVGGVDQAHRAAGDHLLGRTVEGEGGGDGLQLPGPGGGFFQQGSVAPVNAVEKAQGDNSSIQGTHAPKKFLREVITPPSRRLRQRNSPSRP